MESSLMRHSRRRSGYEPSDTETDWHDDNNINGDDDDDQSITMNSNRSPLHQPTLISTNAHPPRRNGGSKSPFKLNNGNTNTVNSSSLLRRTYSDIRRNPSPFSLSEKRRTNNNNNSGISDCPFSQSERRTNIPDHNDNSNIENIISPFSTSERRRHIVSPFKTTVAADRQQGHDNYHDVSAGRRRSSSNSNNRRASASAPRSRFKERLPRENEGRPSVGEINEILVAATKNNGHHQYVPPYFQDSIDSISPGDIFFSKDYKNNSNSTFKNVNYLPKPPGFVDRINNNNNNRRENKLTATLNHHNTIKNSKSSGVSRQSSNVSESSGRTSASTRKFVESRRNKSNNSDHAWFSCINKGSCKKSNKSPERDKERPAFDEASFIGKAVVVESLRPFWADKHQPASLIGFTCHKQEAHLLLQIANNDVFPHILLKGPPGTGKKALTMALLREIYGDPVWNISHDLRYFHILESRPMQVVVPVTTSPHHVELNVYLEPKAAYALTALVKQISSERAVTPEISVAPNKADYKVLVLYDVDKAAENLQHMIKWIMDCYSDSCKLILCCEDDVDILESVKSRCKVIKVEAPATNQIMEVLVQIAKKEGFELSTNFAAKIANKSKQNLRRAIMALEACKLHNYPFAEEQPIPMGWEEAVVELSADILADPLPKRLFIIRGKIQKLLADFVHPKLILLKLVEQFLIGGVEANLKREIYYWYAYYDKRLPSGTSALLKLEEFVAKFMSIYRKSCSNRQL